MPSVSVLPGLGRPYTLQALIIIKEAAAVDMPSMPVLHTYPTGDRRPLAFRSVRP